MVEEWKDRSLIQMDSGAEELAIDDAFRIFGSFEDGEDWSKARAIARHSIGEFLKHVNAEAEERAAMLAGDLLLKSARGGFEIDDFAGVKARQAARAAFGLIERGEG